MKAHHQDIELVKKKIQQEAEEREAMRKEIEMLRKQKNEVSEELNETAGELVNMRARFYT